MWEGRERKGTRDWGWVASYADALWARHARHALWARGILRDEPKERLRRRLGAGLFKDQLS